MSKNYIEMTIDELRDELVKKHNELEEVYKVYNHRYKSYVDDMTNIVNGMDVKVEVIDSSSVCISIPGKSCQEITIRMENTYPKREEVMKKLKVGTIIMTNKQFGYKAVITQMGNRCALLFHSGDWGDWGDGRYEIDDVVNRIVNGWWEIVK